VLINVNSNEIRKEKYGRNLDETKLIKQINAL